MIGYRVFPPALGFNEQNMAKEFEETQKVSNIWPRLFIIQSTWYLGNEVNQLTFPGDRILKSCRQGEFCTRDNQFPLPSEQHIPLSQVPSSSSAPAEQLVFLQNKNWLQPFSPPWMSFFYSIKKVSEIRFFVQKAWPSNTQKEDLEFSLDAWVCVAENKE